MYSLADIHVIIHQVLIQFDSFVMGAKLFLICSAIYLGLTLPPYSAGNFTLLTTFHIQNSRSYHYALMGGTRIAFNIWFEIAAL